MLVYQLVLFSVFFFQAEDGIRDLVRSRGLGDVYKRQEMDLAASIQAVTEEVVLRLVRSIAATSQSPNLCLAGGVALNCVANGKVLRSGSFENIWIQPAAGDAGGAPGAALAAYHIHKSGTRSSDHGSGDRMSWLL